MHTYRQAYMHKCLYADRLTDRQTDKIYALWSVVAMIDRQHYYALRFRSVR